MNAGGHGLDRSLKRLQTDLLAAAKASRGAATMGIKRRNTAMTQKMIGVMKNVL
jgi:hypothetical protein